jgi:hypothetical protein
VTSSQSGLPCGVYYLVSDHIGKVVLSLNSSEQITGIYDYD